MDLLARSHALRRSILPFAHRGAGRRVVLALSPSSWRRSAIRACCVTGCGSRCSVGLSHSARMADDDLETLRVENRRLRAGGEESQGRAGECTRSASPSSPRSCPAFGLSCRAGRRRRSIRTRHSWRPPQARSSLLRAAPPTRRGRRRRLDHRAWVVSRLADRSGYRNHCLTASCTAKCATVAARSPWPRRSGGSGSAAPSRASPDCCATRENAGISTGWAGRSYLPVRSGTRRRPLT